MVEQNLVQKAYGKDNDFESARNLTETALGITIKSKNDILRASALKVIAENVDSEADALKFGASCGAVTKSTAKKLGVVDLF